MASQGISVSLPEDLIAEIDAEVGAGSRTAFLQETARTELRRRRLQSFLSGNGPVWEDENHPELAAMGTYAYVRQLRSEWAKRSAVVTFSSEDEE